MTTTKYGNADNLHPPGPFASPDDTFILGNGANDLLNDTAPSINDTFILGNGVGDFLTVHNGISDTITLGNGVGDSAELDDVGLAGVTHVTLGTGAGDFVLDTSLLGVREVSDGNVIALGAGNNDEVVIGLNNIIGANFSNEVHTHMSVTLGGGAGDAVGAAGVINSTIKVGDGDNDVVAMVIGFGPNTLGFADSAHNDTIIVGNGNNDNVVGGGHDTITLGNGNGDIVESGGWGSLDPLFAGSTIKVGNGNDTIHVGLNDSVTIGTGHDSLVFDGFFQAAPGGIGAVTIKGFNPSKDVIFIQSTLTSSVSVTDDGHGNALVNVTSQDTIKLVGVHASDVLAHTGDIQFI
jgi:hypothetical protein